MINTPTSSAPHWPFLTFLLIHENEHQRPTNTGQFWHQCVPQSSMAIWQRKQIPLNLAQYLKRPDLQPVVVYPTEQALSETQWFSTQRDPNLTPLYILLDGTWQEAKKIHNRSTWLAHLPRLSLSDLPSSDFRLRRNQQEGHLCTFEVGMELAVKHGIDTTALKQSFDRYQHDYLTRNMNGSA
ncbi:MULTISPECIES: tRNA-uridine aminocarboxypropyltransferase [unclassified Vibrio]|uniref:tRNA-uridine aminocarboxypropyltransferase n=1 Tax=Vibrio sp. HB236076 TaxID=3232307 RepID=A0AB39HGI7_9VIBR|nr:DTW domain-containing protein [Vibrio sp. HB161653]MDP5255717.1 DTW domain-containing protein [Vibrio sp. HB161653]